MTSGRRRGDYREDTRRGDCAGSIASRPLSPRLQAHKENAMQLPLQITFRHMIMSSSDAVEARIRQRTEELERFFDRIISCRVVVECRHPRRQQGNLFQVRVDLRVPGSEIVSSGVIPRRTMRMRMSTSRSATLSTPPAGYSKITFARDAATSSCTLCPTTGGSRVFSRAELWVHLERQWQRDLFPSQQRHGWRIRKARGRR
jgi:hypothetical protein